MAATAMVVAIVVAVGVVTSMMVVGGHAHSQLCVCLCVWQLMCEWMSVR